MLADELTRIDELVQINAGLDAQALQQIDHVFGCHIAGCALGIRTATQTGDGGLEVPHPDLQRRERVAQRLTIGIVKMARDMGDVEVLQRETCFKGFYRLDRLQLRHRQFAGGMGPQLSRELFVRHDAVCVLPYDPQRDSVVLIEQFRIGAMDKSSNPWLLELVAGLIDKDEQPEEVARREAVEEADLELTALWPITQYYPSPGGSDERVHLYVGRCDSEGAGGVYGLAEEGEDIRVHVWPLEDALAAVRDGRIDNAASIIALQWLALNRAEVRGLWS